MTIQELSDEMRKERARCSTHCGTWNREDRDCEIYGEYHYPPSKCRYFLETELERRNKEIEGRNKEIEKKTDEEMAEEFRCSPSIYVKNIQDLKELFTPFFPQGLAITIHFILFVSMWVFIFNCCNK